MSRKAFLILYVKGEDIVYLQPDESLGTTWPANCMPDEVGITNQSRNPKAFAMCALSADGDYVPPGYWLHSVSLRELCLIDAAHTEHPVEAI